MRWIREWRQRRAFARWVAQQIDKAVEAERARERQ